MFGIQYLFRRTLVFRFMQTRNDPLNDADPLEVLRMHVMLWILPLAGIAALGGHALLRYSNQLTSVDQWLLWPMAVFFFGLEVYLWYNPHQIRDAWKFLLGVLAFYELAMVFQEAAIYLHQNSGLSPALLWFPLIYSMAFLLPDRKQALQFSVGYFGLSLVVGALGLNMSSPLSSASYNVILQFVASNCVYIALLYIFSHLRHQYTRMHQMAHSDPLTGLYNRRGMQAKLDAEIERAQRYKRPMALLLIDIDHFKRINDQNGHALGDQVLREVAQRFARYCRQQDRVARWGGEEFLVLAPEASAAAAQTLANRLHTAIRIALVAGVKVTVSLGVACYHPGDTAATMLARADEALYRAKSFGRDQIVMEDSPESVVATAHALLPR
jgi:diguanylate cyclase (GGDEF)-like protein